MDDPPTTEKTHDDSDADGDEQGSGSEQGCG